MNRIGVGISKETDPDIAISDVINSAVSKAKLPEVNWVLIFFTEQHFVNAGRLHELIIEKTQCECIAGCSGMGVISLEEEITNSPGLVLMAGYTPEIRPLALAKYQELEYSAGVTQQLGEALNDLSGNQPLFFFFADVFQHQPHNFINMFNFLNNKTAVFGGGSCNNGSHETSIQFGPDIVTLNGAGGLAFEEVPEFRAGVTQSCATLGDPMFVTEVKDDLILSLDGILVFHLLKLQKSWILRIWRKQLRSYCLVSHLILNNLFSTVKVLWQDMLPGLIWRQRVSLQLKLFIRVGFFHLPIVVPKPLKMI